MDTYSSQLRAYNDSNAPLQAGWMGGMWARAAELLRSYAVGPAPAPEWPLSSAQAAAKMFMTVQVCALCAASCVLV